MVWSIIGTVRLRRLPAAAPSGTVGGVLPIGLPFGRSGR